MRRIICAACKSKEVTLVSARHWDYCMNMQRASLYKNIPSYKFEQGFIDQFGVFYNREEAMVIAVAAGQDIDMQKTAWKPDQPRCKAFEHIIGEPGGVKNFSHPDE